MPLSEEELRLLEQMERALIEEDQKFASTLRGTTLRNAARRSRPGCSIDWALRARLPVDCLLRSWHHDPILARLYSPLPCILLHR